MDANNDCNENNSIPKTTAATTAMQDHDFVPLIQLPSHDDFNAIPNEWKEDDDLANRIIRAFETSGFLLIQTPLLTTEMQQNAIKATQHLLCSFFDEMAADGNSSDPKLSMISRKLFEQIITHPTDPKRYIMWDSLEKVKDLRDELQQQKEQEKEGATDSTETLQQHIQHLIQYWDALEMTKHQLLHMMGIGLCRGQALLSQQQETHDKSIYSNPKMLSQLHDENQSALRLLHYPRVDSSSTSSDNDDPAAATKRLDQDTTTTAAAAAGSSNNTNEEQIVIRCKPHSDYGSLTLLLTDGVPGLQIYDESSHRWKDVPHVPGALVVNLGSLLSEWTDQRLLATLHRVVGKVRMHDATGGGETNDVGAADNNNENKPRTSLAFFADPNPNISIDALQAQQKQTDEIPKTSNDAQNVGASAHGSGTKTVEEYIHWRSGLAPNGQTDDNDGKNDTRSGIAFTKSEENRMK